MGLPRQVKDLSGQQFGRLIVVSFYGTRYRKSIWLCRCQCGKEKIIEASKLKSGATLSCGCLVRDRSRETGRARTPHLIGQTFGRLTVRVFAGYKKQGNSVWCCFCQCSPSCQECEGDGCSIQVKGANLLGGHTKSCGCLAVDTSRKTVAKLRAEGRTNSAGKHQSWTGGLEIHYVAELLAMSPTEVSDTLLRPGIIRSKYTKSKGLRISAADVAEYIAHLQREAKECPLGKALALESAA